MTYYKPGTLVRITVDNPSKAKLRTGEIGLVNSTRGVYYQFLPLDSKRPAFQDGYWHIQDNQFEAL